MIATFLSYFRFLCFTGRLLYRGNNPECSSLIFAMAQIIKPPEHKPRLFQKPEKKEPTKDYLDRPGLIPCAQEGSSSVWPASSSLPA
jgi:hypothetical protein